MRRTEYDVVGQKNCGSGFGNTRGRWGGKKHCRRAEVRKNQFCLEVRLVIPANDRKYSKVDKNEGYQRAAKA